MTKLIKKFLGGGTADEIYRASYSLPEIKITDKLPEWFKYLNDYDKARLKSGLISAETAKSIALKRATGTSQYMQDVNKLSWIPNGAMAVAGGMALSGAPQAAKILGNAVFTADVLRTAEEEGIKQTVKLNAPYLLLSGASPLFKIGKFFGLGVKGVKVAGETTGKAVKKAGEMTGKAVKKAGKDTAAGFREGVGKPPKQEVSEVTPNNSVTTIEKFEKWPKKWFKEKKVTTTPEIPGTPAEPDKLFDPISKTYKDVPEGVKKKGLVKKLPDGLLVKKLPDGLYEIEGTVFTKEEMGNPKILTFERFIYPDNTVYGDFLKGSFKKGKAATETIPASKIEKEVFRPWVKKAGWITGLTSVGVATPYIINSIKTENSSQENTPLQLNNTKNIFPEIPSEYYLDEANW